MFKYLHCMKTAGFFYLFYIYIRFFLLQHYCTLLSQLPIFLCRLESSFTMSNTRLVRQIRNASQLPTPALGESHASLSIFWKCSDWVHVVIYSFLSQRSQSWFFVPCPLLRSSSVSERLMHICRHFNRVWNVCNFLHLNVVRYKATLSPPSQVQYIWMTVRGSTSSPSIWSCWEPSPWCWWCSPASRALKNPKTARPTRSADSARPGTRWYPSSSPAGSFVVSSDRWAGAQRGGRTKGCDV